MNASHIGGAALGGQKASILPTRSLATLSFHSLEEQSWQGTS